MREVGAVLLVVRCGRRRTTAGTPARCRCRRRARSTLLDFVRPRSPSAGCGRAPRGSSALSSARWMRSARLGNRLMAGVQIQREVARRRPRFRAPASPRSNSSTSSSSSPAWRRSAGAPARPGRRTGSAAGRRSTPAAAGSPGTSAGRRQQRLRRRRSRRRGRWLGVEPAVPRPRARGRRHQPRRARRRAISSCSWKATSSLPDRNSASSVQRELLEGQAGAGAQPDAHAAADALGRPAAPSAAGRARSEKYSAAAISSGHSVTSCAVRNSQACLSPLAELRCAARCRAAR